MNEQLFTRVMVPGKESGPFAMVTLLKNNPHPNIAKIYDIGDDYYDVENVGANARELPGERYFLIITLIKEHLQSLGIYFLNWNNGDLGVDAHGTVKLNLHCLLRSSYLDHSYEHEGHREALSIGCRTLKDIDDYYSFYV